MTLNKRLSRLFLEHKAFYIGMLLLIILSSAMFFSFRTATTSIRQSVNDNRIHCKLEDANFTYSNTLSDEQIAEFERKYNLVLQKMQYIDVNYEKAILRIRPEYKKLNLYSAYEGKKLSGDNEILVDTFFFEANHLKFGDTITLEGQEFVICGKLSSPDYISMLKNEAAMAADGKSFGLAVVREDTFDSLSANKQTYYSVKYSEDNSVEFRKELTKVGFITDYTPKDNNIRIVAFDGEIDALVIMANIAPLFIMLVSCLIMAIVVGRMLKREYSYIGTLVAMGYKKKEIFFHYLRLPIIVSVAGSAIGLAIGYFLAEPMEIISKMEYAVPPITLRFNPVDIAAALLIPVFLSVIGSAISITKALRINTVLLLKANASKGKKPFIIKHITHKKGSFKFRFKLKEMLFNIPRSALMIVGIIVAGCFILSGFVINSAVTFLFENSFDNIYDYKYQYIFNAPQTEDIQNAEGFMVYSFVYEKDGKEHSVTLNGIENHSKYIDLRDISGNTLSLDHTVISNSVANRLNIKAGDTITIKNNATLEKHTITVGAIADINAGENIYIQKSDLNKMLSLPNETYIGVFADEKLSIDQERLVVQYTRDDNRNGLESSIALFKNVLYILAAIAGIIGIIVIYIVTLMLIEENSKNISMLKVMGYNDREISALLLRSTTALVVIGFALSIPCSIWIMNTFFKELTVNMYFAFTATLTISQILIGFAFILFVYYFTLFFAKRKVLNISMAESLKARE